MYLLFPAAVPLQINIDTQNKKILPEHSACLWAGRSAAPRVDMSDDSRAGSSADSWEIRWAASRAALTACYLAVQMVVR